MLMFMAFCVFNVNFCARDACMMTTQCGAFCVHNVNFRACDAHTMHTSTTEQCGACSGSPQLVNYMVQIIVEGII